MNQRTGALFCLLLIVLYGPRTLAFQSTEEAPKHIPDSENYASFLYADYKPERLNVLIFKDPFCPYCIRAIDTLDNLENYNVFVFWAPILSEGSVNRVNSFFKCDKFAGSTIFNAVKARLDPQCKGDVRDPQLSLNNAMVNNYNINSVPSYFIQGQATSYQTLVRMSPQNPHVNGVKLDWQRYAIMQNIAREEASNLTMVVPANRTHELDSLLSKYNPQFVFLPTQYAIERPEILKCSGNKQQCIDDNGNLYKRRKQEFELLFGHSYNNSKLVLVDYQGKMSVL